MKALLASIAYNLRGLARFGGRDNRAIFWPYAGFVIVLAMVVMAVVMLPGMTDSMTRMQEFAAKHPELATVRSGPGYYSISVEGHHPEFVTSMRGMMTAMSIVLGGAALMLAAAIARRLHDAGRSGLWGLMPLPFITFAILMTPNVFGQREPDMSLFFSLFFNNLLYLISLVALVILLAKPSVAASGQTD